MPSSTAFTSPIELLPLFQEKVWGRHDLAPYYPNLASKNRIGEVWFTFKQNQVKSGATLESIIRSYPKLLGAAFDPLYPDQCPLLAKLLFTTERLSVQVHPGDEYAHRHHQSLGKTEAWYVVAAESAAGVAIGFKETLTRRRMAEAARSGEIEALLDWRPVKAGDLIFVPAGTVHAIGAGVTICEIQQNSDITYRLYDYGRPRELHLEHGVNVADLGPHHYRVAPLAVAPGREELVACEYFRIERLRVGKSASFGANAPYYMLLTCLSGKGSIAGQPFTGGQTWLVPAFGDEFALDGPGSEWILSYTAAAHAGNLQVD